MPRPSLFNGFGRGMPFIETAYLLFFSTIPFDSSMKTK